MEHTPLSTPGGERGKDKKDDKKKSSTLRVPLYASEVHTDHDEPKVEEPKKSIAEELAHVFSAEKKSKAGAPSDADKEIKHEESTPESPTPPEVAIDDLPMIIQEQLAPYEAPPKPAPTFTAYEAPKAVSLEAESESKSASAEPAAEPTTSEISQLSEEPAEPVPDARGVTPPPPPRPPVGHRSAEAPQPEPEPEPQLGGDLPAAAIARRFYQEQQRQYGEPEPIAPATTSPYARERVTPADLNEVRRHAQTDTLVVGGLAYVAARHHTNKVMRKHERSEAKQLHMRDERIAQLEAQQDQYRRQQLEQHYRQQAASPQPERPVASTPNVVPPAPAPRVEQASRQPEQVAEQTKTAPVAERRPTQGRSNEEEPFIPAGHHLERSEWHTIEMDDKTGKPVERQYGEAMRQERAPEQMLAGHTQSSGTQQDQDMGGPGAGIVGIGGAAVDPAHYQSQSQAAQQQTQSPSTGEQILANVKSPWFWLVIIFLLIVFFSISFL